MQSSKNSSADTQSLSETEKGGQSLGTEDNEHASDKEQQSMAAEPETPYQNEKALTSGINVSDWNGDDDPDNPYNCMFLLLTFYSENLH